MAILADTVPLNAKITPDKKAVVLGDKYITYRKLNEKANQLAHGLISLGVKPGTIVAILGSNSIEWVIIAVAIAKSGAVALGINFRYKKEELIYVINDSDSAILFFGPQFAQLVEDAKADFAQSPKLVTMEKNTTGTELMLSALMEGRPTSDPDINIDPKWPVNLTYTSGTTGIPKGVLNSHENFLHNITASLVVEGDTKENEIHLHSLPLFHLIGFSLIQHAFIRRGTLILMEGSFDPDKVLEQVAHHQVTVTMWVPTQLAMLVNSPAIGKYDVSSLRKIFYGSSPISPPVLEAARRFFNADFYQFYGSTEGGLVMVLRPEDHHGERSQFTGREIINTRVRIVDENGKDVKVGEIGEIISRNQGCGMIGYYKNDEANRATIKDGWIHTGDLARVEENGYFTIVDRLKDMIISGAENIYPKEIETVISTHPGVKEIAVFGIPDDVYGESVGAAVVRRPGYEFGPEEIIDYCAKKLSGYKKPKRVVFLDDLPKNASGKVTKNVLREPFWAGKKKRI